MTTASAGLTPRELQSAARIAGLTVVNALVFQDVLASHDSRVQTLQKTLEAKDIISALCDHWQFILQDINYVPIFHVARQVLLDLASGPDTDKAVRDLAGSARQIVRQRAALRHDLMGRVYHRLLVEARYLGTYYTSVPAATLLLKLTLSPQKWTVDWSNLDTLSQDFRMADLACGTGTLLMAAVEAVADNYVRACAEIGHAPDLGGLHRVLIESIVHGYDVLPSALHLTASTLALRAPDTSFGQMHLYSLPLGGPHRRLGSIEFLSNREVPLVTDLFDLTTAGAQVTGAGDTLQLSTSVPDLDLCVMNPPFTRSVGGNRLFGSLPDEECKLMQADLRALLRSLDAPASSTAGLGSVFVAVGDKYVKQGGRMALVLPKGLLSGVAWGKTRRLFALGYQLEYLIVSHEPGHWNFSENTNLSEVLVIARKADDEEPEESDVRDVTCVNLWKNPSTMVQAMGIAHVLSSGSAPDVELGQGALEVVVGTVKFGEAIGIPWQDLRDSSWVLPCAFAQSELIRASYSLSRGALYLPGSGVVGSIPLCALEVLGDLGPDRRDIWDGFNRTKTPTAYPAFWGHIASKVRSLSQAPNRYLSPLSKARPGRPLRTVEVLWPRAGRILLAERLRLNTQRLAAIRLSERVLSNVWWPFATHQDDDNLEKALVLWLNSTLGLLVLLAHREETEGAWVGFKKPILEGMPVLDPRGLSKKQRRAFADAYDSLSGKALKPLPKMHVDSVRREIDEVIAATLGLPDFSVLRQLLAQEPVVCLEPLS